MVTVKIGNILNCEEDIIVHQVNVQGIMGGGVAWQLSQHYPGLEEDYRKFCETQDFDYNKLKGRIHVHITNDGKAVVNMFSQKPNFDTDYQSKDKPMKILVKEYPLFLSV